jgi:hypothetical protein
VERTCFVHIGAPKTGSTFLQKTLADSRPRLLQRGLIYPSSSLRGFGHHDIAFLLSGGYPAWATPQDKPLHQLETELAEELAGHDGDVLISSEDFYLFPEPARLTEFLAATGASAGRRIRIVVYVRRQDELQEAWYNQRVKAMGETRPIQDVLEESAPLWDYTAQLAPWTEALGREAMLVRRYRPVDAPAPGLLADFLSVLGLADLGLTAEEGKVNPRENRDILEFQRRLNQLPLTPQQKRRFHKQLMALSERTATLDLFDQRPLLDADQRRSIVAHYRQSNVEAARLYLGEAELFDDTAADGPMASPPLAGEGLTADKLIHILGWILASDG